ncbi:hypothetical protein JWZ98_02575 [Methylomonas sp. EFPC1]|uniref:hypothetical protein n=1 Tax=Methylomonas sp. EFPC1 TaxID=2812647 RepID=UPI001967B1E1|nr:hypothetical protein [Methylomonas sp. EFPC1]QSB01863.1 hypothetical protein JWZ98_02575 [Methylomonas sp. EFPC1]
MTTGLIDTEQLKTVTGYDRPGDIERCLRAAGVRFLHGKNGKIFTTIDAINAAMGLKSQILPPDQEFEFLD